MLPCHPSPSSHPTGTLTVVCRFEHNLFPIATPSDTVAPLSFSRSLALSCCSAQKYAIIFLPLLQQLRAHKQINTQPARCGEKWAGGESKRKPAARLEHTSWTTSSTRRRHSSLCKTCSLVGMLLALTHLPVCFLVPCLLTISLSISLSPYLFSFPFSYAYR